MSFKLKITSRLDKDGRLDYNRVKLQRFYKKLKPVLKDRDGKADLDLYLVYPLREKNNLNSYTSVDKSLYNFTGKLKSAVGGEEDKAAMLLSSQGSITNKQFFETVCEVFKSK